MSWLELVPAVLVAIGWLAVPGIAALWLIGVRGLPLAAGAGAVSVAFIGGVAILFGMLGVPWNPLTVLAAVVAAAAVLGVIRLLLRRRWPFSPPQREAGAVPAWTTIGAWALAAVVISVQLAIGIGGPDAISQTFDNGFHLNAVRHILDTGNASTFAISGVINGSGAYPAAWHDLTSLVVMSSGAGIPAAANAVSIAVSAFVWPGAVLLLARVLFPKRRAAVWISAVLSAGLPWFPLLMLTFGVLFPFFLAVAFLPLAFGLIVSLLRKGSSLGEPVAARLVMLVSTVAAMALAQPAVALGLLAFALPVGVSAVVDLVRRAPGVGRRAAIIVGAVVAIGVIAFVWRRVGAIGFNAPWGQQVEAWEGVFEVLLYFVEGDPPTVAFAILVLVGLIVTTMRPGRRWMAGTWLVGAGLLFVAEVIPHSDLRNLTIGLFYKDPPRLATLFMVMSLPVAIAGALFAWKQVQRLVARLRPEAGSRVGLVAGAIGVALLLVALQGVAMRAAIDHARAAYRMSATSPILTFDELALIERLPATTGLEGRAAGNPWTGSNLAYALAGQPVLNPHFNAPWQPEIALLNHELNEAASSPEVCDAVRALDVRWVLDFGSYFRDAADELSFDSTAGYEGLLDLEEAPGFVEVDREGGAVLYRVDACN
ncbi:DUF6541 family protein [Agromyces sp. H66]|uniref:DUF6541 family protein n=1 Tax=Agromyces sp. H66 TaxID=2529859 RepID=UPI0010AA784A|nr:DUF6541 family protein [Agromyces sp. H66]